MTNSITFQQLESHSEYQAGNSPLDEWYQGIRSTPINEFDDGDLARACRQQLYLSHVVPTAVERLQSAPLAGDMYDGELLVAMKSVPIDYWQTDKENTNVLASIVQKSQHLWDEEELTADADELARRLQVSP